MLNTISSTIKNEFSTLEKVLVALAVIAGVVFIVFNPGRQGHVLWAILKIVPILFLALFSLKFVAGSRGILLFLGLLFSAGGDFSLAIGGQSYFVQGLGCFLVAHIFYIIAFSRDIKVTAFWTPPALLLSLSGAGVLTYFLPLLGDFALPVTVYLMVLVAMGVFANYRVARSRMVFYGSLLFLFSDSLIATNTFLSPLSSSIISTGIMISYYFAQLLIAGGFLFDEDMRRVPEFS